MAKSDKEPAVELVCTYISAWFSHNAQTKPLDGKTIQALLSDTYSALRSLSEDASRGM